MSRLIIYATHSIPAHWINQIECGSIEGIVFGLGEHAGACGDDVEGHAVQMIWMVNA